MKKLSRIILSLCLTALMLSLSSCNTRQARWYDSNRPVDDTAADVFYIVSTEVVHASDPDGSTVYRSRLVDADRTAMEAEMAFACRMFGDSLNFFSPFYHQYTFDAIDLSEADFSRIAEDVADEVCGLFDEYMERYNNGRKFILAGFSQGAQVIPYLLRHMTDEQYSRMAAAYMMGFQLSEEDLNDSHIIAADNADDFGETVSYNSVLSVSDRWDRVSPDPACCINPVNWETDATAASFEYDGDAITVSVDPESNLLIISCSDPEKYRFAPLEQFCSKGNMHHWDLMFYGDFLRTNALHRLHSGSR